MQINTTPSFKALTVHKDSLAHHKNIRKLVREAMGDIIKVADRNPSWDILIQGTPKGLEIVVDKNDTFLTKLLRKHRPLRDLFDLRAYKAVEYLHEWRAKNSARSELLEKLDKAIKTIGTIYTPPAKRTQSEAETVLRLIDNARVSQLGLIKYPNVKR